MNIKRKKNIHPKTKKLLQEYSRSVLGLIKQDIRSSIRGLNQLRTRLKEFEKAKIRVDSHRKIEALSDFNTVEKTLILAAVFAMDASKIIPKKVFSTIIRKDALELAEAGLQDPLFYKKELKDSSGPKIHRPYTLLDWFTKRSSELYYEEDIYAIETNRSFYKGILDIYKNLDKGERRIFIKYASDLVKEHENWSSYSSHVYEYEYFLSLIKEQTRNEVPMLIEIKERDAENLGLFEVSTPEKREFSYRIKLDIPHGDVILSQLNIVLKNVLEHDKNYFSKRSVRFTDIFDLDKVEILNYINPISIGRTRRNKNADWDYDLLLDKGVFDLFLYFFDWKAGEDSGRSSDRHATIHLHENQWEILGPDTPGNRLPKWVFARIVEDYLNNDDGFIKLNEWKKIDYKNLNTRGKYLVQGETLLFNLNTKERAYVLTSTKADHKTEKPVGWPSKLDLDKTKERIKAVKAHDEKEREKIENDKEAQQKSYSDYILNARERIEGYKSLLESREVEKKKNSKKAQKRESQDDDHLRKMSEELTQVQDDIERKRRTKEYEEAKQLYLLRQKKDQVYRRRIEEDIKQLQEDARMAEEELKQRIEQENRASNLLENRLYHLDTEQRRTDMELALIRDADNLLFFREEENRFKDGQDERLREELRAVENLEAQVRRATGEERIRVERDLEERRRDFENQLKVRLEEITRTRFEHERDLRQQLREERRIQSSELKNRREREFIQRQHEAELLKTHYRTFVDKEEEIKRRIIQENEIADIQNQILKEENEKSIREAEDKANQLAAEEAQQRAQEEELRKAEEEAIQLVKEQARKLAAAEEEEEARRKAEEYAQRLAEEAAQRRAEEDARREAVEKALREAEEKARILAQKEAERQAAEDARKRAAAEEAQRQAEAARRRAEEEAEAARRREQEAEAAKKRAEAAAEAARKVAEDARRDANDRAEEAAAAAAERNRVHQDWLRQLAEAALRTGSL